MGERESLKAAGAAVVLQPALLKPWTVGSLLEESAKDAVDQVGIVAVESTGAKRCWTYGELIAEAERTARALLARFEPGERVAIWAPNVPEWVRLQLGAALARITLVTVKSCLSGGPSWPDRHPDLLRGIMNRALIIGLALLFSSVASAHSWYPELCCGGKDCEPVKKIVMQGDGSRLVISATGVVVVVPKSMTPMPSQDGRGHICYIRNVFGAFTPRCYFEPGTS